MSKLNKAVEKRDIDLVRLLIDEGEPIDHGDSLDRSPLQIAIMLGDLPIVKLLVESGANVCHDDVDNWTPLHYAVFWGRLEIVKYLLRNGAEEFATECNGRDAHHLAKQSSHTVIRDFFRGRDTLGRDYYNFIAEKWKSFDIQV